MNACRNKALFLDRDGVINVERGHVHRRESFEFMPGIFELCRAAHSAGYLLIVVTNQAGIARGYYSEADFSALTDWMMDRFSEQNIKISGVYYCPYHPVFGVGEYRRDSPDRKPNPGMLLRAKSESNLDMASSILIGDKDSDMEAGSAASVGTLIFLSADVPNVEPRETPYYVSPSLDDIRLRFFSSRNSIGEKHEAEQFHKVL
jgi:D-glycero-D-manno-heptose 1,7-bisphosphate phosphatase